MKLEQLAAICGARLVGDGGREITNVARIEKAGPTDLCFATGKQYAERLAKSKAGAVITRPELAVPEGMAALLVDDPDLAFSKAVEALRPARQHLVPGVSEGAFIGPGAVIGDGASIGALAYVGARSSIGKNAVIYPQAYIGDDVVIGDDTVIYPGARVLHGCRVGARCEIMPGVCIGGDGFGFHFVAGKFVKAPQRGIVVIEDDVEIGANTCVDRARFDETRIGKGTKIDNLVQIAHNCIIGKHCIIAGQAGLAGSVTLQDYVQMGGNSGVTPHVTIGMGSKIAAKSGVMKDIPPGQSIAGLIGDDGRVTMKREAAVRRLPEALTKLRELEAEVRKLSGK